MNRHYGKSEAYGAPGWIPTFNHHRKLDISSAPTRQEDDKTIGLSRRSFLRTASRLGVAIATGAALTVAEVSPAHARQHLWAWCYKCSGLWFTASGNNGYCPAGNIFGRSHQTSGSGDYVLKSTADGGLGDDRWRHCQQCQGLWLAGGLGDYCPNSGNHRHSTIGSGIYLIEFLPDHTDGGDGQHMWRHCEKCGGMFFIGNGSLGVCPAGNTHSEDNFIPPTGSGIDYFLRGMPGDPPWR
jgi:hypothetical protein